MVLIKLVSSLDILILEGGQGEGGGARWAVRAIHHPCGELAKCDVPGLILNVVLGVDCL